MTRQHVIRRPHHPHRLARQLRPPQRRHWSWRHTHSHPGQSGGTSPNGLAHAQSPSPSSRRGSPRGSPRRQRHALLPHAPWHPKQRIRAGLRPSPSIWRACLHSPCWHAAILSGHTADPAAWAISVLTATACGCLPAICSSVFRRASRSKPVIRWMATLAFMMLCQFLIGPALVFPGVTGDTAAFAVGTDHPTMESIACLLQVSDLRHTTGRHGCHVVAGGMDDGALVCAGRLQRRPEPHRRIRRCTRNPHSRHLRPVRPVGHQRRLACRPVGSRRHRRASPLDRRAMRMAPSATLAGVAVGADTGAWRRLGLMQAHATSSIRTARLLRAAAHHEGHHQSACRHAHICQGAS